ncbi:MAG: DUF2845 domain-containing protein [Nitrospiria bacterium]
MRPMIIGLAVFALAAFPIEAFPFRCGMGIVTKGARKIEVLRKCGRPAYVDAWRERRLYTDAQTHERRKVNLFVEEWTYNFGSNQLIRFFTFHNGKVVAMTPGAYGFNEDLIVNSMFSRCGKVVDVGDKKIEVLRKCGQPVFKDRHDGIGLDFDPSYLKREEWTYNFGPTDFLYFITFQNGKVLQIEAGPYGF